MSAMPAKAFPSTLHRRKLWELIASSAGEPGGHAVREPAAAYGGTAAEAALSPQAAHRAVRAGLPPSVLDTLAKLLDLGVVQLAAVLDIDRATLRRYTAGAHAKGATRLPSHTSETVLRLAQLEALARATFETEQGAHAWLKAEHPLLEGESPLQAAGTSFGAQRVREMLVAIRWGAPA